MNSFLQLPKKQRLLAFQQVDDALGLQAVSVEKDFWVCWLLRELFTMPNIGAHLTFKGGTSLSKAWKLIHRFSEDIDLIIDKELFGYHANELDNLSSNKRKKIYIEKLMSACRDWVQGTLQLHLRNRLNTILGKVGWLLEVDPEMPDGQCLLFHYPSLFVPESVGYVRPVVKIEFGARSDDWPNEEKAIQPYVTEHFPDLDADAIFKGRVLAADRTFWEKACLLHEENFRPLDKPRKPRMARHYYDIWCLLSAGIGELALKNLDLFHRVVQHRKVFFPYSWINYSTHMPGTFRLLPSSDYHSAWEADYKEMLPMFFGEAPSFNMILTAVAQFENKFNVPPDKSTMSN